MAHQGSHGFSLGHISVFIEVCRQELLLTVKGFDSKGRAHWFSIILTYSYAVLDKNWLHLRTCIPMSLAPWRSYFTQGNQWPLVTRKVWIKSSGYVLSWWRLDRNALHFNGGIGNMHFCVRFLISNLIPKSLPQRLTWRRMSCQKRGH